MYEEAVACLACPHCGRPLRLADGSIACAVGHSFDVARQGYVNLLPPGSRTGTGDTAPMVAARERVVGSGLFSGLAETVADSAGRAAEGAEGCVVEVGAGTGYYLSAVLERLPGRAGLALDVSKHAARRAACAHPRAAAVVCDVWRSLPVRDGAASLVLDVFAPRNAREMERVLRPGGALVVGTPTARHLEELVDVLGMLTVDARKAERLAETLGAPFDLVERRHHEEHKTVPREIAAALAAMGPSAHHADGPTLARRVASLPETVEITLSATVSVYRSGRRPPRLPPG